MNHSTLNAMTERYGLSPKAITRLKSQLCVYIWLGRSLLNAGLPSTIEKRLFGWCGIKVFMSDCCAVLPGLAIQNPYCRWRADTLHATYLNDSYTTFWSVLHSELVIYSSIGFMSDIWIYYGNRNPFLV